MSKPGTAWFPFYIDDWDRATDELTNDEEHAYFRLVKAYYGRGQPLKDDDHRLAIITRRTPAAWRKLRPVMAGFFCIKDGLWRHKRIDRELDLRASLHAERSRAGSHGNERRWKNSVNGHDRPAAAAPNEPEEETQATSKDDASLSDHSAIAERSQNDPYSHLHLEESSSPSTGKEEDPLGAGGASLASPGGPRDAPQPPQTQAEREAADAEEMERYLARRDAEKKRLAELTQNRLDEIRWKEDLREQRREAARAQQEALMALEHAKPVGEAD